MLASALLLGAVGIVVVFVVVRAAYRRERETRGGRAGPSAEPDVHEAGGDRP